jgi:hypothetical protein
MKKALGRVARVAAAAGTIATIVAVSTQTAHAGIGMNHCEPVFPAPTR